MVEEMNEEFAIDEQTAEQGEERENVPDNNEDIQEDSFGENSESDITEGSTEEAAPEEGLVLEDVFDEDDESESLDDTFNQLDEDPFALLKKSVQEGLREGFEAYAKPKKENPDTRPREDVTSNSITKEELAEILRERDQKSMQKQRVDQLIQQSIAEKNRYESKVIDVFNKAGVDIKNDQVLSNLFQATLNQRIVAAQYELGRIALTPNEINLINRTHWTEFKGLTKGYGIGNRAPKKNVTLSPSSSGQAPQAQGVSQNKADIHAEFSQKRKEGSLTLREILEYKKKIGK